MCKHILVPLDGSAPAEAAIPVAAGLATTLGARVTLMHVIERNAPATIHGAPHLTQAAEATAYLEAIRTRRFPADMDVTCHVHTTEAENVARSIVEHQQELTPDLIVMCAHGRRSLHNRVVGRLAQQVVGLGRIPVMLVAPDAAPAVFTCRRLLVPVDGQPEHAVGLDWVEHFAQALGATLDLLLVVPPAAKLQGVQAAAGQLLPSSTRVLLDLAEQGAAEYLHCQVTRLHTAGVAATGRVLRGNPADVIVQEAARDEVDGIVLPTHGHAGTEAFWAGSVASDVVRQVTKPILLIPVHGRTRE